MIREPGNAFSQKPFYPVDEPAYRLKKEAILQSYKFKKDRYQTTLNRLQKIIYNIYKREQCTFNQLAAFCEIPEGTIKEYVDIQRAYDKNEPEDGRKVSKKALKHVKQPLFAK